MDIFLLSLLTLLVFFIFFFYKPEKTNNRKHPPGKTGWPIIGESLEFVSTGRSGHPERFVNERMNKYSPEVFKTSIVGETMAVLCGPNGNKFLFSNENKLLVSWWPPTIEKILSSSNTSVTVTAKRMKKIIPEFIKPEALKIYIPIMDFMTRKNIKKEWSSPSGEVKAFPLSKNLTFSLACKIFMSIEDPSLVTKFAHSFELVVKGLLSMPINLPGTAFNCAIKAANFMRDELSPIIKRRRNELKEKRDLGGNFDLLSKIMIWSDEDGIFLNEMEIADMILGILFASHDTTSAVIAFVVYYLADHPDVYARVLEEQMQIAKSKGPDELLSWEDMQRMKYSRNVVNEVLRLQPPAQGTFRHAISDFTYGDFVIPKGWKAFWSVHTTHKDPKYFPNPEKFDPSRFEGQGPTPFTFVPFGGGPRMCPGNEFARLLVLVFMHRLVTKFKWEKLFPNEKIVYQPSPIPVNGLPIRLSAHQH